jgi:hypothetical protein
MIRPITCVTLLLACGSGLYLYQAKHRVHVLDGRIEQVVRQTAQVSERIRVLRAEWTLLDQPDRLQQLAGQFLDLQPTKPAQFASAADLDSRLPSVPEPDSAPPADSSASPIADAPVSAEPVIAAAPPPAAKREPANVAALAPPMPVPVHVAEHPVVHVAETAHPQVAAPRGPATAPPAAHPQLAAAQPVRVAQSEPPNPAPPRLIKAALPRPASASPNSAFRPVAVPSRAFTPPASAYGGSMLGMARGAAPPPPAPMWFNWNNR